MLPSQTVPNPGAESQPALANAVKDVIVHLMMRQFPARRIAELIEQNFHIKVERAQMLACWYERHPPKTQGGPTQIEATQTDPAQTDPTRTGPGQNQDAAPLRTSQVAAAPRKACDTPRGANAVCAPVIRDATGEDAPTTRTGPGQDKESVQFPADEAGAPLFTRMPDGAMPDAARPDAAPAKAPPAKAARSTAKPATRTGPGQNQDSAQTPSAATSASATRTGPGQNHESEPAIEDQVVPDAVKAFIVERMARHHAPWMIADAVQSKFGFLLGRDEIITCWRDRNAEPDGPGPEKKSRPILTDEVKTFIVKRLACYETPSRIAAAVSLDFGIDIDRRRVFDYNPAGSRPPARRWIDLHAVTRAKFLRDVGEIGIAQKVVRLRLLDRLAEEAEDDFRHDKAAKYAEQAAKECGGFYERNARLKSAAAMPAQ